MSVESVWEPCHLGVGEEFLMHCVGSSFWFFFFLQTCDFFSNSGAGDVLSHPNQIARFVGRPFRFQPNTEGVALFHSERHFF